MRSRDSRFRFSGAASDWLRERAPNLRAVSKSRDLIEKLQAAGKPVDDTEQPLGEPFSSRQEERYDFPTRPDAFLARHNPA